MQKGYPKEQMSLVIMDTFKDNDEMRKLWTKTSCEIIIVPHNLTNKFQPLDIRVNKAAKSFISDKCVSLKLSVIKPLHVKWIVDLYNTLKDDKEIVINGFRSAGIAEAIENA